MKYFKTIEGMLTNAFQGEKDDNGKPIIPTEKPMTEKEYLEYKRAKFNKQYIQTGNVKEFSS